MFLHLSVSHSVHRGGCLHQCMLGYTTPSWTDTLWADTPWADTPLAQCMLGYTPPAHYMLGYTLPSACWDRHGYCCGRSASHWNAFLLVL